MYSVFLVLIIIVAVLLILIVLVQNSKGGGLASNFSSSNQVMGVRKTTDFLEKATWTLATVLLVLCVAASLSINRGGTQQESAVKTQAEKAVEDSESIPTFPTSETDNSENSTEDKK